MSDFIVAITGGIGSGKSTAAKLFKQLDVPVIDTDEIAKELVTKDSPFLKLIIDHFGETILESDGTLNKKSLQHIIFEDHTEKEWLENLLHPTIWELAMKRTDFFDSPYCLVIIPLLIETLDKKNDLSKSIKEKINHILVVDASTSLQIQRTQERDRISLSEIENIIHSQAVRTKRLNFADDVITNTGDLSYLKNEVKNLHKKLLLLCKK